MHMFRLFDISIALLLMDKGRKKQESKLTNGTIGQFCREKRLFDSIRRRKFVFDFSIEI